MRKITFGAVVFGLAGSMVLIGVTAAPALMATTGETLATVNRAPGAISITGPDAAVLSKGIPGTNSTVTLSATKVIDDRPGSTNWTATIVLPQLSNGAQTPEIIPTTAATYLAAEATTTGSPTLATPTPQIDLSTAKTAQTTTKVTGNNTASWTATLTIPIPAQALAGIYTGTMTQSVS